MRARRICEWGGAVLLAGLLGNVLQAQEIASPKDPASPPPLTQAEIRQVFVPADESKLWPRGDWQVLDMEEYKRLLEGLKPAVPSPAETTVRHARYQAVFTGEKLEGRLLARIQRRPGPRLLFPWDHSNLALSKLSWADNDGELNEATWGSTSDGRTLFVLPATRTGKTLKLQGTWNAPGRRFAERVEFDLNLAPATVSELDLLLPKDWELAASAGHVKGPLPIRSAERFSKLPLQDLSAFRLWRISLGSEHDCQLSLTRTKPGKPAKPLVLAEVDTSYLVRERELQIEARYDLKVAFAPITEMVFHVPRTIRVYAVTYGGDANLGWQVRPRGNRQQVVIQLPDPLLGESRPIRIQGLARVQSGRAWKLPQITCPGASLLRGEVYLTVEAPLELGTYDARGYRQTAISVKPDQRETLTFSQLAADAEFTAYLGTPPFSMSAEVVNLLTTETEEWQMRSEVAWNCQAGSRFVASCEVLPGWEILDVRRVSESALPVISDWRLSQNGKAQRLTIEFLEALTPMQAKRVQILARRLPMSPGQSLSLSCVKPLSCRSVEQFLSASLPKGSVLSAEDSAEIVRKATGKVPEFVQNSGLFSQIKPADGRKHETSFYAASADSDADPQLTLHSTEPPFDASVLVTAALTDQTLDETLEFSIQPLESPVDQITLKELPAGDQWDWEFQPAGQPPKPIPPPTTSEQNPPNEGLWSQPLPVPQSKAFRLLARRSIAIPSKQNLTLPFLPAAREFQGTVELSSSAGVALDIHRTNIQETPLDEMEGTNLGLLKRWKYQTPDAALDLEISRDGTAPNRFWAVSRCFRGFRNSAARIGTWPSLNFSRAAGTFRFHFGCRKTRS